MKILILPCPARCRWWAWLPASRSPSSWGVRCFRRRRPPDRPPDGREPHWRSRPARSPWLTLRARARARRSMETRTENWSVFGGVNWMSTRSCVYDNNLLMNKLFFLNPIFSVLFDRTLCEGAFTITTLRFTCQKSYFTNNFGVFLTVKQRK